MHWPRSVGAICQLLILLTLLLDSGLGALLRWVLQISSLIHPLLAPVKWLLLQGWMEVLRGNEHPAPKHPCSTPQALLESGHLRLDWWGHKTRGDTSSRAPHGGCVATVTFFSAVLGCDRCSGTDGPWRASWRSLLLLLRCHFIHFIVWFPVKNHSLRAVCGALVQGDAGEKPHPSASQKKRKKREMRIYMESFFCEFVLLIP